LGPFISGAEQQQISLRFCKISKKIQCFYNGLSFFVGNSLMFLFGAVGANGYRFIRLFSEVMFSQGFDYPQANCCN